jgi:ABC-type amino acid transport substrate-binding protein
MAKRQRRISIIAAFFFLFACTSASGPTYSIGLDPTFFPSEFYGKEVYIYGFIDDLFREVSDVTGMQFIRVQANGESLLRGLDEKKYHAAISNIVIELPENRHYSASNPFLATGPVLVMRQDALIGSFKDLKNQEIAVARGSAGQLIMEGQPQVFLRFYDSATDALADIATGKYDGAVVPYLFALNSVQDLYRGRLKVVTKPLNHRGLRLIARKGDPTELLDKFNQAIAELEQRGEYAALLAKWRLGFSSTDKDLKKKRWWQRR